MSRSDIFSFIGLDDESDPIYCGICAKAGVRSKYQPAYDKPDKDNWLQCPVNGNHIIPIYEGKLEGEYGPVVDLVDNAFDSGTEMMSVDKHPKRRRRKTNKLTEDKIIEREIKNEKGEINILSS